ncbi:hypothetical protein [Mesorhizobium sp. M0619]|uniref:hypothetical protein n=1 Tax=unclassified Mesorhizobium TaxID=325217 RepID=UPI00333DB10A
MARWRDEWRRIDAITAAVHRNSGGPDLARLNDQQRVIYAEWRRLYQTWRQQFTQPDALYAAMLEGGWTRPTLPLAIRTALYGEPISVTTENARDVYVGMIT